MDKTIEGYLLEDVDDLDNKCNALLDYGDVDYFDTVKCIKLNDWIKERLTKPIDDKYRQALEVLKSYCEHAIELKTGIMVEL